MTKRRAPGIAIAVLTAFTLSLGVMQATAAPPAPAAGVPHGAHPRGMQVERLTTEHAVDPLGIDVTHPRLSWILSSPDRGARQSAYQVVVSRERDGRRPVWDSGKVHSTRSYDVAYAGRALESRTRYTWQVRVWDENGRVSGWSKRATFETAFVDDAEFAGEWIGSPNRRPEASLDGSGWIWGDGAGASGNARAGDHFFRTEVEIPAGADIVSAQLQVTADDYFALFVNGSEALSSPTQGEAWRTVRVTDLASDLHTGKNVLAVRVTNSAQGFAGLLGKLRIELADGTVIDAVTDDSWRASGATTPGWEQPGFDDSGWSAAVVGAPYGGGPWGKNVNVPSPPEALVRKDFDVATSGKKAKKIASARAYVTGLGYYKLFLNGQRVGDHELDPGFTVYDKTTLYATYDVTKALRSGENVLGVSLGRGYFGQTFPDDWAGEPWHDDTKLKLELDIAYVDGTTQQVVSDRTWSTAEGPTTSDSVWMGESYDARLEQPGWNAPGFDDSSWRSAVAVASPGKDVALRSQQFPAIEVTDQLEHTATSVPRTGTTVYDFASPTAGWAKLTVDGPAGATVTVSYGEKLKADGTVDSNLGFFDGQTYRYTLKGGGPESYQPSYSYAGFRYVQVTAPEGVTIRGVDGMRVHTAVERTGGFGSSDDLLNRYHEAQANTILNNLHSIPTDTPMYEKRAYTADAYLTADSAIAGFDMQSFYESWVRTHRDDQLPDGTFGATVPGSAGSKEQFVDPLWSSSYVLMTWNLYWYYGNTRALEDNYAGMKKWLDHYEATIGATGNVYTGFSFGDWLDPTPGAGAGTRLPATAYLHRTATLMAKIATVLGKKADAAHFETFAGQVADAFNDTFYDEERGTYADNPSADYRQTANVLPLAFGIVPEEHRETVLANLVKDVEVRGNHLSTGAIGTKDLLPVLTDSGHGELAYDVATNPTYPGWGYWFEELGATTMWEEWPAHSRSQNHAFFGTVDDWLYQQVAGITPAAPGFSKVKIQPSPVGDLDHASATVDSPLGQVTSSWQRSRHQLTLRATVPVGATAEIHVPARRRSDVTAPRGASYAGVRDGYVVYEVGSGDYEFRAKAPDDPR
ncbi:family 78 glycoside hydrolase catalytic domain [Mumia sp. ZJ1417]|uniref:family 78 glycoside hydrolase catalytic domain n=1 Tax=Mumia sp. ZJ1417 TaxID=2708082 RepID=UPI001AB05838|nr:family 78 glycoside hydrolase catalytic domain [Mumia sp. ZJ1417]